MMSFPCFSLTLLGAVLIGIKVRLAFIYSVEASIAGRVKHLGVICVGYFSQGFEFHAVGK